MYACQTCPFTASEHYDAAAHGWAESHDVRLISDPVTDFALGRPSPVLDTVLEELEQMKPPTHVVDEAARERMLAKRRARGLPDRFVW